VKGKKRRKRETDLFQSSDSGGDGKIDGARTRSGLSARMVCNSFLEGSNALASVSEESSLFVVINNIIDIEFRTLLQKGVFETLFVWEVIGRGRA
jgi:hypothetical protein